MPLFKMQRERSSILIKRILILTFLYVIHGTKVSAQLKASFTADKTSGCVSPTLIVNFKNTTQNASATASYSWDFGGIAGVNTSTLANPSTSFKDPKVYTVTLTVTDGGKTSSASTTITVHKLPIAEFSASPTTGCVPMTAIFADKSDPVEGKIDKYLWDFGDGNTKSGTNLGSTSNNYMNSGKYMVELTVTNSFGCESKPIKKEDLITTNPQVTSLFQAQKTTLCTTFETVSFTNSSTVTEGSLTSYLWNFGDGNTSADKNPTHIYLKKGIYTVSLTATSDKGCTDLNTKTNYINVANFSSAITLPSSPICQGVSLSFSSSANPTPTSSNWYFSDNNYAYTYSYGTTVYDKPFYNAGTYTALLVNNFGGCKDTAKSTFIVSPKPILNGFFVENKSLCGAPVTVNFNDTSSETASRIWTFDYFNTSTLKNPSYNFSSNGSYFVSLVVKNKEGCPSDKIGQYLSIYSPDVRISLTRINDNGISSECLGLTYKFNAAPLNSVSKYLWKFGDGSTSTDSMPTHTYDKAGNYTVTLNYTTFGGCTGSTSKYGINVYNKPTANFYTNDTLVCGNTPVFLMNTSTQSNNSPFYKFTDSLQSNYYTTDNNSFQFLYPGTYSVTLIVRNGDYNGYCYDTITKKNYIKVFPPFPKIAEATNTCDGTRGEVVFRQNSRLATRWLWDYGDKTYDTLKTDQKTINHTYLKSGNYKVVHTAINGRCSVRDSVQIAVLLKQNPILTLDRAETCGSDKVIVSATNYVTGITGVYNILYRVEYGDGNKFMGGISPYSYGYGENWYANQYNNVTFSNLQTGESDLRLITRSYPFYCLDTTNFATLKVKGPKVNYEVGGSECFKKAIILADTSAKSNVVPIKIWQWDFGDGSTQQTKKDSVYHIYDAPGRYYTSLKVTDADGCTANTNTYSYEHQAITTGPKANFTWSPFNVSPNSTAEFLNTSIISGSSSNSYLWHFSSNNSTSTSSYSINHSYTTPLTDTVTLIAKSNVSTCIDTVVKYVPVTNAHLSFTYTKNYVNNNNCPPMIVNFTSNTYNIQKVTWLFGNGKGSKNNFNPSNTYYGAGKYKVTLIGYGYNGEVDTVFDYVTVKGPYADITTDKTLGCLPNVTITLTARNRTSDSLLWDFGDGILLHGKDSSYTYTYKTSGAFNPSLIISDTSGGCQSTLQLPLNIISDTLSVTFKDYPIVQCLKAPTKFNATVLNVAVNYIDTALQYRWDFGTINGDTSTTKDPNFVYQTPGRYKLKYYVKSISGCEASATDSLIVKPIAPPTISGPSVICEDVPTQYFATVATTDSVGWYWQFNNGKTDSAQKPALQSFKAPQSVDSLLVISNLNGCPDSAFYPVTINPKPHINLLPQQNDTLCLGKSLQLTAHDGKTYRWYPTTFITDTTAANPTIYPDSNTTYFVTVTNSYGCVNTDSAIITVALPIKLKLLPTLNVCINDSVQLTVSGASTYKWTTNIATLSDSTIANPKAKTLVDALYKVTGYDSYNCFTDTDSTQVLVKPLPIVNRGNILEIPVGTSTTFNPQISNDVVSYSWIPIDYLSCSNCLNPFVTPRLEIPYTFTGKTIYGCAASATFGIKLKCTGLTLKIPNAFTPERTENNRFYPIGKGVRTINRFAIYSRTGQVLFERKNFNINDPSYGWDGKYAGKEIPSGTYVYLLDGTCDTGDNLQDKGTVVLLR